jgi:pimeloyl-ACP methyl ester carboxylesterase
VLTNCDAFDAFPPAFFVPLFKAARYRPAVWFIAQNTRPRLLRHSPLAFGPLISRPRSAALTRGWVEPVLGDASIRRDVSRFARGIQRTELIDAADWLATFDKPTRVVWGMADRHFKVALARRLVAALPHAELVEVDGSATFVSIDQPDAVTAAVLQVASDARTRASNTG